MKYVLSILLLLACSAASQAGYCYSPASYSYSYTPSYSGYNNYYQPQSYQYYPAYYAYPTASYLAIPVPVFGSVYVGANGATNVTTTQTRTQTATSTQTAATGTAAAAVGAATTLSAEATQILASLKTLTSIVGQVAQKQESMSASQDKHAQLLLTLQRGHDELRQRMSAVEGKVGGGAPPPAPIPPPKKDGASGPVPMPKFYALKCFSCHQDGQVNLVKVGKDKIPVVLFTKAGERAPLLVNAGKGIDWAQAFLTHVTENTMPPATMKDGKRLYPELTPEEQTQGVVDLKNFPRRES